jgi:acetyl-CoA acetyltransferase
MSAHREVGIIGIGQSKYYKKTDRTLFSILGEAARNTLDNAGVSKSEIDGFALASFLSPPDNAVTVAETFGISVSFASFFTAGGAGSLSAVMAAIDAVERGKANYVLVLAGDVVDVDLHYKLMSNFNDAITNYTYPAGHGGANGFFGIIQRKHMEKYGTRREDLGRIAVGQRRSATLNENALLRGPMTIDDYMNCRPIAEPIHLYDCVLPCSGAEAVLIGPLDRAPKGKGIRMLSGYERHNHPVLEVSPLNGGWETFQERLWHDAGFGPKDMQFVQAYDDYPIMVAIQLEDLGFCKKGEVSRFLADNTMAFDGSFPVNTGGGQLSCGQSSAGGGMIGLFEACAQIRNEVGERQVIGAERGLVAGFGMVGYGHGLGASAMVVEKAQ